MRITVTQEDIDRGVRANPWWCPIAAAIRRTLYPDTVCCGPVRITDKGYVSVTGDIRLHDRLIGAEGQIGQFLSDFDSGKDVYPFSFELPPLSAWAVYGYAEN